MINDDLCVYCIIFERIISKSLFLVGVFLLNSLDNSDGNGLFHVSDGESSEGRIFGEDFNAHGLLGDEFDHGGIT